MAGSTDVVVRFIGDSSSVQSEVAKVEGTGSKISSWAKGVGVAVAGAFAVKAVKDFIDAASSLQDALGATGAIFGKAAKDVVAYSETTADAYGISQRAALEGANTFAAFGKAAGLTGKDLSGFSTDLVGLAGDLSSFKGGTTEEAINAVGAALRNEAEPIRAYGVLLDEGTLKARAMSMGLVSAVGDVDKIKSAQIAATAAQEAYNKQVEKFGKDSPEAALALQKLELSQSKLNTATQGSVPDLTAQQKVLAANAEIFVQTGDAQGDAARNADNAAIQQKKLTANIEDTQAALGTALLPVLSRILPVLEKFASFVEENATWLVPLTAALFGVAAAVWVVNAALAANPFVLAAVAVAALVAAVILLWQNWDAIWAWIMDHKAYAYLIAVFFPIIAGLVAIVAAAKFLSANWETIWNAIKAAVGAAVGWITDRWNEVLAVFRTVAAAIAVPVAAMVRIFDTIKEAATAVYNWVKEKIEGLVGIFNGVKQAISTAAGAVAGVIKGPINTVIRAWNRLEFKVPEVDLGPLGKIGGQAWRPPHIDELAKGGIVTGPTLALIGERGPEAVIPLSRGAGGMANTYNINVQVAAGTDPVQAGRAIVQQIGAYERANGRAWRDIA